MTQELTRYYAALRERNRKTAEERYRLCVAKDGRFSALSEERGAILKQLALGKLTNEQAQSRIAAIRAERRNHLIALGLSGDYLDPIYTCPKCRDTGEVGEELKTLCTCALKRMQATMQEASGINERETFAAFDASVYPDEAQKQDAMRILQYTQRYAEKLPKVERPFLVLIGRSGLGKTFFANAIAHAALQRGIRATKVTAYRLIQDAMDGIAEHSDRTAAYTRVPLLVLDDLGTEPMIPTVTAETFFRIFNERLAQGLPTVIGTNLGYEELAEQYGERVASRLFDGTQTRILPFRGRNLRMRER